MDHRIRTRRMKWRRVSRVLYNYRIPTNLKGEFYNIVIESFMLYDIECQTIKKQHVYKMSVTEMRILR